MTSPNVPSDTGPIDDTVNVGTGLDLLGRRRDGRPAPMATCPRDGEPLMSTLEFSGAEFLCMVCGNRLGFLAPRPADVTPELQARHDELRARFNAGERP